MNTVIDHYSKLLASIYLWMAGGAAKALELGAADLATLGLEGSPDLSAIDLGSGFGMHAVPLARLGYAVTAIDSSAVVHAATLHKPHVATHSWQDFIDTNVTGPLHLLDAAVAAGVTSFIYVSTTSVFGTALLSEHSTAAAWVTEDLVPRPKNIYGHSKLMGESLCELTRRKHRYCGFRP